MSFYLRGVDPQLRETVDRIRQQFVPMVGAEQPTVVRMVGVLASLTLLFAYLARQAHRGTQ